MTKIYTKKGDSGKTSLVSGTTVPKSHIRLKVYGAVDELNAFVGLARTTFKNDTLEVIQNKLFNLGSQLACDDPNLAKKLPHITESDIEYLENNIDEISKILPPLKNFILPGGHSSAAALHICRTVCRRVERLFVELSENETVDNLNLIYLNRLSDYFFVAARLCNHSEGVQDIEWSK